MDAILNSKLGLKIGLAIASTTPPRVGYAIARLVAYILASRKDSDLVQNIRLNQQMVSNDHLDSKTLDQTVFEVLFNSASAFYDLYHHLNNLHSARHLFVIEPSFQRLINRPQVDNRGLVIAGLHMAGFDLALQWLCPDFLKPLALTLPNSEGGRALEFQRRVELGIQLVPGSFEGIRKAIRFLQQGGIVVTGIDRPNEIYTPQPNFFGIPAALPSHHIFLALKTNCPVVVAASHLESDGHYYLSASPLIEMDSYPDKEDQLQYNAEKVLTVAEEFIRRHPSQWLCFQPVWEQRLKKEN